MLPFFKSLPRTSVHHYHDQQEAKDKEKETIHNEEASTSTLTVWRKSLVLACSGFTVICPDGTLAFRVDNYTRRPHHILLMDGLGNPIFTIRRPKLVDKYWLVYEGDRVGKLLHSGNLKPEPILSARRNMIMGNVIARVYCGESVCKRRRRLHVVEGSYADRSCKILDGSRRVVGEIKKKGSTTSTSTNTRGASFGLDVFELVLREGLESRLGMAIVLLLDQM